MPIQRLNVAMWVFTMNDTACGSSHTFQISTQCLQSCLSAVLGMHQWNANSVFDNIHEKDLNTDLNITPYSRGQDLVARI